MFEEHVLGVRIFRLYGMRLKDTCVMIGPIFLNYETIIIILISDIGIELAILMINEL